LDIPACEVLERALERYDGTLLVISHDREFLDRVAAKILWVEAGRVRVFEGNWSEARRKMRSGESEAPRPVVASKAAPLEKIEPPAQAAEREKSKRRRREKTQAKTRLAKIEEEIARFEARAKELAELLSKSPTGDWEALHALVNEEQELRGRLERRYREWERMTEMLTGDS
jgi:ATPase subunit of ABC transporter with duplicated ATPase domains